MTVDDAIKAYTDKFGGFPYYLLLAASDETIIKAVEDALEKGEPIKPKTKDTDY